MYYLLYFFFFQAEDGIRDLTVTGVQTCALPILDNPNSVGLRLDEIDFDLFINDTRILDGISQQRINIPANGRGDMRLRTSIGYDNLRSLWTEIVSAIRGERARYEIRGNAYYDTPIGRLRFPVSVYSTR